MYPIGGFVLSPILAQFLLSDSLHTRLPARSMFPGSGRMIGRYGEFYIAATLCLPVLPRFAGDLQDPYSDVYSRDDQAQDRCRPK